MKRNLDHLPEGKRRELAFVVEVLREGFASAVAERKAERFRQGQLLKIILFGSYARDDWVEDPVGRYFSDYDLLVVVDHEDLTDVPEFWMKTEERLLAKLSSGEYLRTPVSLIYHSLELGRYFFLDILQDGIELFAEPGHPSVKPEPLTPAQALRRHETITKSGLKAPVNFQTTFAVILKEDVIRRRHLNSTKLPNGSTIACF